MPFNVNVWGSYIKSTFHYHSGHKIGPSRLRSIFCTYNEGKQSVPEVLKESLASCMKHTCKTVSPNKASSHAHTHTHTHIHTDTHTDTLTHTRTDTHTDTHTSPGQYLNISCQCQYQSKTDNTIITILNSQYIEYPIE